nr:MAG: major capsid protein [Microvirus sp.]
MVKSALHNLSHSVKFSGDMGKLIPIATFDCVPGDKINHKIAALIRTQPLLAPVMHAVDVELHCFYTPERVVWPEAEKFQSGGDDGLAAPVPPYMNAPATTGYAVGSLGDYLGLPTGVPDFKHSALPFRMYNMIWNYYYRDSQLQAETAVSDGSGEDTTTARNLLAPCWKRDYFTKARPSPQLGAEVTIPLTGDAPVKGIAMDSSATYSTAGSGSGLREYPNDPVNSGDWQRTGDSNTAAVMEDPDHAGFPKIFADLSQVSGIGIRELREAGAFQRFMEFNNMFGGRYIEQIMARFGMRVPDYRFQEPQFLGAGETKIQFSEVLQTGGDTTGDPTGVGNMRGHGISIVGSNRYKFRSPEHGWVMCFLLVRPKTQYMQGLHRAWSRETKYDYLLPEFERIGDQPVLNKELYVNSASPNAVFGYTPMYEEYRTIPSRVAGDFRDTLDFWHMARIFASEPALNSTFVGCNPTNRIFPITSANQLYVDVEHKILARRPLGNYPTGRLM